MHDQPPTSKNNYPDEMKGSLKRSADVLVCHGRDIPDGKSLYQVLTESGSLVKLFYVSNANVDVRAKKMLEVPHSEIKGTMKIH